MYTSCNLFTSKIDPSLVVPLGPRRMEALDRLTHSILRDNRDHPRPYVPGFSPVVLSSRDLPYLCCDFDRSEETLFLVLLSVDHPFGLLAASFVLTVDPNPRHLAE